MTSVHIILAAITAAIDGAVKLIELLKAHPDWHVVKSETQGLAAKLSDAVDEVDELSAEEKARLDAAVPRK